MLISAEFVWAVPEVKTHEVNGDVIGIDANFINISTENLYFKLKLMPQVKIYCNGLSASWKALLPITSNAFFEARVVLNPQNQVVMVDGSYRGEECIIQGWQGEKESRYLTLSVINSGISKRCLMNRDARLPEENWLLIGQVVFVLYNLDGKVRAIYLPD